MKNIITISVLLLALAVPEITHASWWNPFTWFPRQALKVEMVVQEPKKDEGKEVQVSSPVIPQATTSLRVEKVQTATIIPRVDKPDYEPEIQASILEARIKAEEQLRADSLKAEIERQVRIEIKKIQQEKDRAVEEKREAELRAEQERNRITITVGDSFCSGDKLVLPYRITGPFGGAVVRVYSENGAVDMRSGIGPSVGNMDYGNVSDLKLETTSYGNPSDSPYLNGTAFKFSVEVYDRKIDSKGKKVIAEHSGDVILPSCH